MLLNDIEILQASKRKFKKAQAQSLIINDEKPYHRVERKLIEIYISHFATAYTDECLSNISQQSLDKKNKLPIAIAFALVERHIKVGKYSQALKIIQTHIDRKTTEKLFVLTYNTAKIHQILGNLKNAVFFLQNLLKQEPFRPQAIYDLSFIYSKSFSRNSQALLLLQRHLSSILKDNSFVHSAFLSLANDSKLNVQQISKIMANRSINLVNYYNLALLFKKKGDSEKSCELFQQLHDKLIQKQQSYLEKGNIKDIKLIILTKLNLIQLKQKKQDCRSIVGNLSYFLLQKYKKYLDSETITKLNTFIYYSQIKVIQTSSQIRLRNKKQVQMFQSNFNFHRPREAKCLKNSSFTNDKQFNNMRSFSNRKLKYLLQKEKQIQKFFKNLTFKKSQLPNNVKMSIKNSIERAKQEINEYKLKSVEKEEYLKFQQEFQQKKLQKQIQLNQNQIIQSIQAILNQLQNSGKDLHKNNKKVIMPLNSLLNQKSNIANYEPEKTKSLLVTKRDLLKKCANFKKQKISINFQLQKNEKKVSSDLKQQISRVQQNKKIGNDQNQATLSNISQKRASFEVEVNTSKRKIKTEQKENQLAVQLILPKQNLIQSVCKPIQIQIIQEENKIQVTSDHPQEKQLSQNKYQAQNIPIIIKQPSILDFPALSFKKIDEQHKEETKNYPSINQFVKIETQNSFHPEQQNLQQTNIFQSQKSDTQILEIKAHHQQQKQFLVMQKGQNHPYLQIPNANNQMPFQRSHTVNLTDSQNSQVQPLSQNHLQHTPSHVQSIENQRSLQRIQRIEEQDNTYQEFLCEEDPLLQQANQQQPHNKIQNDQVCQKSVQNIDDNIQDVEQKLSKDQFLSQRSLQTEKEQKKQQNKKQQIKLQNETQKDRKESNIYNATGSSFQMTGLNKILLGKFDQNSAPSPTQTLQIFFNPYIKLKSVQPSPQIQQKLSQASKLQKESKFEQAYKILTALYKQYKGESDKQVILLAIGKLFEIQHKYEQAERTYFKCTKYNSAEAFLRLGSLLLKLGRVEAGIENLQKADCIKRFDVQIENKLVYGYSLKEQTMTKALNLAHNILKKHPNSIKTLIMTAGILQKQGLIKQAIEIVTQIDKVKSTQYIKHYLGILYLQDSNLTQAYNSFKGALSIKPDYIPSLIEVASIISDISAKQAIELLNKVLEMQPCNRKALARLGKIYESVYGDFQSAMRTYQTALNSQENYESYIKIGDCLAKKQSYIEALLNYKQALNLKKTSIAYAKMAEMYEKKMQYPKAIQSYQSALAIIKQEQITLASIDKKREYLMSIGRLSHKIGQFDAAIASFQQIIEGVESAQLYKLLGQSYFGKREHEMALQYFEKANNLAKGEDIQILQNLAICLDQLGEYLASKAIYQKIFRVDSNNVRCLNNLANILLITGQTNEAFQTFEILLQKTPRNLQKRLKIADIYAQVGDWSKVQYHLLQCYRLKEHDPKVLQKLVTLYKQKRDLRMVAKYQKKLALRGNHKPKAKQ